jgi:hypothetical protein
MLATMSTPSFLLAIERFLAIRPRPTVFLADNGTNFLGGDNVLKKDRALKKTQIDLAEAQKKLNIEFRFAPPQAPHFMGLVERIVGTAKAALKPAIRTAGLLEEELRTIFPKQYAF